MESTFIRAAVFKPLEVIDAAEPTFVRATIVGQLEDVDIVAAVTAGGRIDDTTAAAIAAAWQSPHGLGRPLLRLAEGEVVEVGDLLASVDDIREVIRRGPEDPDEMDLVALDALAAWAVTQEPEPCSGVPQDREELREWTLGTLIPLLVEKDRPELAARMREAADRARRSIALPEAVFIPASDLLAWECETTFSQASAEGSVFYRLLAAAREATEDRWAGAARLELDFSGLSREVDRLWGPGTMLAAARAAGLAGQLAHSLRAAASEADRELAWAWKARQARELPELLEQFADARTRRGWSPSIQARAWEAAEAALAAGFDVRVDTTPDGGLAIVIDEDDDSDEVDARRVVARLPIRAGVSSSGRRLAPPDVRPVVAELTAIDAAMPHDPGAEWPEAVSQRREELIVRLWRMVSRPVWLGDWPEQPEWGYEWDTTDERRPLVLVVRIPGGPEIRGHVRGDAVEAWELEAGRVIPWDGQTAPYRERVEWLARAYAPDRLGVTQSDLLRRGAELALTH